MDISLFLAKAFGIYLTILGIAIFKSSDKFKALTQEYFKSSPIVFLGAIMALFIGSSIVALHNIWALDWRLIITLLGWLTLLKGIFLTIWPEEAKAFYDQLLEKINYKATAIFYIALGVLLSAIGYMAK